MFKAWRENPVLAGVSLVASIALWLYVRVDSAPTAAYTRTITAEVSAIGAAPPDVKVRFRPEPITVDVSGPRNEVDRIGENEIKAEVDVSVARVGTTRLRIVEWRAPSNSPGVEIKGRQQYASVDVFQKAQRQMPVKPMFNALASPLTRYGTPQIRPEWASVSGAPDDVKRVSQLVVTVETSGRPVSAEMKIRAEDRDNVEVRDVEILPAAALVEVALEQPPATRGLVVSVVLRGKPAAGHVLADVLVDPPTVVVAGKAEQVQSLSHVPTEELNIEGISGEVTRQALLRLPSGVALAGGKATVRVTFRTQAIANGHSAGGGGL